MSYCRWSSDDFMCDLYCYEDVRGGWTTHVASNRNIRRPIAPSPYTFTALQSGKDGLDGFAALYRDYHDELKEIPSAPIGLPYDGQTFNDPTLEDFRARVVMLKAAGYNVPDYVLTDIDEEIAAESTPTPPEPKP